MRYIHRKNTNKEFDDHLDNINGVCLFDTKRQGFSENYSFFREATTVEWETVASAVCRNDNSEVFVRYVDPCHPRFGSIARLQYRPIPPKRSWKKPTVLELIRQVAFEKKITHAYVKWDDKKTRLQFKTYNTHVEYLPGYNGPTVMRHEPDRAHRVKLVKPFDRLDRPIHLNDFCCYILYQFEAKSAASICFGNVTRIDIDGTVWCKNIKMTPTMESVERRVKDNNLITVMTESLMNDLMIYKLRS